ncbi:LAGLIDADG family homing endonuclease [Nanoarchaeota archaeon]
MAEAVYEKIKELRKQGHSFNEISRIVNYSKTHVRRISKGIKFSKEGFNRYQLKVKGIIKNIKINKNLSRYKVRIITNLIFDGAVYLNNYHYSIMYVNSSKFLIDEFQDDMFRVYKVKPSSFEVIKGKNQPIYRVKYLSKLIYEDLNSYVPDYSTHKSKLPLKILINNNYKIIILRSFWENEGSISKDGRLSADSMNEILINQLSRLHNDFGISHKICKYWKNRWAYKLYLHKNMENYSIFNKLKLFDKSIVTKGAFVGQRKRKVLLDYMKSKIT